MSTPKAKTRKPPTFTLVTNHNDWEGLYVDGVLHTQGHTVRLRDLAAAAGFDLEVKDVSFWLGHEVTHLPDNLKDIPKGAFNT